MKNWLEIISARCVARAALVAVHTWGDEVKNVTCYVVWPWIINAIGALIVRTFDVIVPYLPFSLIEDLHYERVSGEMKHNHWMLSHYECCAKLLSCLIMFIIINSNIWFCWPFVGAHVFIWVWKWEVCIETNELSWTLASDSYFYLALHTLSQCMLDCILVFTVHCFHAAVCNS